MSKDNEKTQREIRGKPKEGSAENPEDGPTEKSAVDSNFSLTALATRLSELFNTVQMHVNEHVNELYQAAVASCRLYE